MPKPGEIFFNREISWLEFNRRVLEEARDLRNPLFERLKFEAIAVSNLDEFFMVRVASINDQILAGYTKRDNSGLSPKEQLDKIKAAVEIFLKEIYSNYHRSLQMSLKKERLVFLKPKQLDEKQRGFLNQYFFKQVFPVLTPMVVDKSRPFPLITNRSLNIALLVANQKNHKKMFATVQVPSVLERFIEMPENSCGRCFILLEDILKLHLEALFQGYQILHYGCYRITRNADLTIDEEGAEDLLEEIEQSIKKRKWGYPVRLEYEHTMHPSLLKFILKESESFEGGLYPIKGPIDLTFLMKFYSLKGYDSLKYPCIEPMVNEKLQSKEIFAAIRQSEILLHHPYESFQSVVDLVQKSAQDPAVLAIKQTLYRVSGNSPIIKALERAAENGKQVTVLVELKARFDEENNINWARRLEESGAHVIYGLVGLKTHCKLLLIVRQEEDGIRRYIHMGTGNYNDVTANFYTDTSILTAHPAIGFDASSIFNMLSGLSEVQKLEKLEIAPTGLRQRFVRLIRAEAQAAQEGKEAHIIAKMNSLIDEKIISELYAASQAGVHIELLVRGMCCLVPGLPGLSETITVRSIVGRYLEHSRIYYFLNGGEPKIFMSSADWMPRNLDRRVELLFPVQSVENIEKVTDILRVYLQDTEKTRILHSDGTYTRINRRTKEPLNAQEYLFEQVKKRSQEKKQTERFSFRPKMAEFEENESRL